MNGLALQIELGCDVGLVLCNGSLDFSQDAQALSIAYSILWAASSAMASLLLGSTKLTRTATANREFLKEQRAFWEKQYQTNLEYVTQNAALSASTDCLTCKDEIGMKVGTVFSTTGHDHKRVLPAY
jgi:hypothetical protein